MTQNAAAPHARLVVSRGLLLKSAHHHDGMYRHGAGYYLLNGRWHKLHKDKPAPKGAPVVAHPGAGGTHAAVAHLTQEQWDALKLPDTNTNAPSYNKALANLQQLSDVGNVTGMLAVSYGSNTYGQKLAKIANHLLGLHGSPHQVAPGQKAGTHSALQAPTAPAPDLQEPGPLAPLAQHVKDTLDTKATDGDVEFIKLVAANNPEHPQIVAYANKLLERLGANEEQGAPAAGTYDHGGIKKPISGKNDESGTLSNAATGWLHAYQWGVDSPAGDVKNPIPSDDVIKELSAFVGKSPVKLYRAVYLDANDSGKLVESWTRHEEHASVLVQSNAEMGKKMKIISQVFQPADIIVDTTKLPKKFHNANDSGTQAEVVIALGSLKKHVAKLRATTPAPTGPLAMPAFEEGKTTTGVVDYYKKVAQKIIDHGHAGNASVLEGMKTDGLKPNAKGKVTNTWLGKTANSKKLLALHAAALAHATGGSGAATKPPLDQQMDDESIPLPSGIKTKIDAMDAGELSALVATHSGPGGFKKILDYAQAKLAAADTGPKEGDTKPGADGGTLVLKDGHWVKQGDDSSPHDTPVTKVLHVIPSDDAKANYNVLIGTPKSAPGSKFSVLVKDGDSGQSMPTVKVFTSESAALQYAHALAAGKNPYADVSVAPAAIGDVFDLDSQYEKMNAGKWTVYNLSPDGQQVYMHKVGAKVPNQANSSTIPAATLAEAIANGTAKKQVADAPSLAGTSAMDFLGGIATADLMASDLEKQAKKWLAANPGKDADLSNALIEYGFSNVASEMDLPAPDDGDGFDPFADAPDAPADEMAALTAGQLTPQQLLNLQSIPWFKLKLPPENTNAKSHNAALAKIEAMAFAGDTAGLQAFIDAKGGAKQTYAKKQALTAQTALAGLQQPGATAAVPVAPQPKQPSLTKQLASASGAEQKLAVQKQFLATNGESARTFKQLADAFEKDGDSATAQYWSNKAEEATAEQAPVAPPPAAPKTATAPKTILHNTTQGHNKSWSYHVAPSASGGFNVVTQYGKIGGTQQKTVKRGYPTADAAHKAGAKLADAKLNKGYAKQTTDWLHKVTVPASHFGPKEGDTKQGADGMLVLKNGHWVKMDEGDALVAGWKKAIAAGKAPTKEQADHLDQMMNGTDGDPDAAMEAFMDAVNESIPPELQNDSDFYEALETFTNKAHSLQADALASTPLAAPAPIKKLDLLGVNKILQSLPPSLVPQATFATNHASKMALAAAKTGDAAGMAAAYSKALDLGFKKTGGHIKAVAEAMGVDTSKWDGGSVAAPAAAPAPAAKPAASNLPSMDSWIQIGGQAGSNPGGKFRDADGVEWYCKFPPDEGHARSEVLAAKLYEAAGLKSQDAKLVSKGGKVGIASRWVDVKKVGAEGLKDTPGALGGFVVDAWLANWDVVGMGYDNLQVGSDGRAVRVDAGGSLQYRAQGAAKPFGHKVEEIKTMRGPKTNPQAAAVFGTLTAADMTASAKKVLSISDDQIHDLVMAHGPGDVAKKAELIDALIARKEDIAKQFPKAVPKEKVKPKPDPTKLKVSADQLPKPHDFQNWKGAGSGLSSKAHVNEANQAAEQALLDTALKGNLIALKDYHFDALDKETGAVVGKKPISEHPSNHVKTYWSDLVSTLSFIAYPPEALKKFKAVVATSITKVSDAFNAAKYGTTTKGVDANSRLAFWIALGSTKPAESLLPPGASLEFQSSPTGQPKVTTSMAEQAKAAYHALNAGRPVKRFINGIQSSGSYNDNFRDGRMVTADGWDATAMALDAYGYATEKPEGFELYKWISFPGDMGKQMLSAPTGTVFQNPGSMCCSTGPTGTAGFGADRVRIRYAKGAKAVDSFGSGNHPGEKEITTLPGQRFVILKCHKVMCPVKKKERIELDVLMLPPDPTYVAELETMKGKHGGKS